MIDPPRGTAQAAHCGPDVRRAMLGRTPLFRSLDEGALARVDARCRALACDPGQIVQHAGDPADALYVVASGAVKLATVGPEGRAVLHDVAAPGETFGALRALGDEAAPHDATCIRHGCLLVVSADTFRALLREVPEVAAAALEATADRLRDAQSSVASLSTLPVEGRLAEALLRLARKSSVATPEGRRIDVAPTQVDLAAMVGTSAESVSRVFARWRAAGVLGTGPEGPILRDEAALERAARGEGARGEGAPGT